MFLFFLAQKNSPLDLRQAMSSIESTPHNTNIANAKTTCECSKTAVLCRFSHMGGGKIKHFLYFLIISYLLIARTITSYLAIRGRSLSSYLLPSKQG